MPSHWEKQIGEVSDGHHFPAVCDITNHRNELAYHHADCSVCSVGMDDTGFNKIVKQKGA